MSKRKDAFIFRFIRTVVKLVYRKIEVEGIEKIPTSEAILVANHCKMNGPICSELYLPDNCYTWCAGEMMNLKEVPSYAYSDFWADKPKVLRPFYKLVSYIIAPFSVCIFNNARTIPVYHDMRVLSTFKAAVKTLKEGKNMVVFPETAIAYNNVLNKFQDKFVDAARLYYKSSGKIVKFVPVYIAPTLGKMYVGDVVDFDAENDIESERSRICECLSERICDIAVNLPEHKVVPYKNVTKKNYLTNTNVGSALR